MHIPITSIHAYTHIIKDIHSNLISNFFYFFSKRIIEKGSGDKRRTYKGSTPTSTRKSTFKEVRHGM